jgi:hypothetical protein
VKIPRPLRDVTILTAIEILDREMSAPGVAGSFGLRFHYGPEGQLKVTIEAPSREFTLDARAQDVVG